MLTVFVGCRVENLALISCGFVRFFSLNQLYQPDLRLAEFLTKLSIAYDSHSTAVFVYLVACLSE